MLGRKNGAVEENTRGVQQNHYRWRRTWRKRLRLDIWACWAVSRLPMLLVLDAPTTRGPNAREGKNGTVEKAPLG